MSFGAFYRLIMQATFIGEDHATAQRAVACFQNALIAMLEQILISHFLLLPLAIILTADHLLLVHEILDHQYYFLPLEIAAALAPNWIIEVGLLMPAYALSTCQRIIA